MLRTAEITAAIRKQCRKVLLLLFFYGGNICKREAMELYCSIFGYIAAVLLFFFSRRRMLHNEKK